MVESSNTIESTRTSSNQSTVIIILLAAGCIFTFYSINGLRFIKISLGKDGLSLECAKNQGVVYGGQASIEAYQNEAYNSSGESASDKQEFSKLELVPKNEYQDKTFFERKILNTLWRYQQRYRSPDAHWTFTLYPNHPEYANFQWAIAKLIESRLVYFDRNTEQYSLTASGREFMKDSQIKPAEEGEFYPFNVEGD